MSFPFAQRLQDLSDHVRQDEQLLKSYEDALRLEDDPRRRHRYQQEIAQLKQSVERYRQEYAAIEQQLAASTAPATAPGEMQAVATQIDQMDAKLNLVLSGQVEVYQQQHALLQQYDAGTQAMLGAIAQQLTPAQVNASTTLLAALDANALSEPEMQQIAATLSQRLPALMPSQTEVAQVVSDPNLDAKHKLKVSVPIIPLLLDYEGEIELGSGFNLKNAWERVKTKLGELQQ